MTAQQKDELDGIRCGFTRIANLIANRDNISLMQAICNANQLERDLFEWQCKADATLIHSPKEETTHA